MKHDILFSLDDALSISFLTSPAYNIPALSGSLYLPLYTSGSGAYMAIYILPCPHATIPVKKQKLFLSSSV